MSIVPDLGKLRIDRDQPAPAVRRAFRRVAWFTGVALLLLGALAVWLRRGSAVPVDVVAASLGGGGGAGGPVGVVANGYVVARTKAAVSAKIPGRLASLDVMELNPALDVRNAGRSRAV